MPGETLVYCWTLLVSGDRSSRFWLPSWGLRVGVVEYMLVSFGLQLGCVHAGWKQHARDPGEVLRLPINAVVVSVLPLLKHRFRVSRLCCSLFCQWWYFCYLDAIWVQRSLQNDVIGVIVYLPSRQDVVR